MNELKLNSKMMTNQSTTDLTKLHGLGGWLVLFQLRMWLWVPSLLSSVNTDFGANTISSILGFITIIPYIILIIGFYNKSMIFRTMYIIIIALNTIIAAFIMPYFIIMYVIVDVPIMIALFNSKRVKNTFN